MKVKTLGRAANCCWSPENIQSGIYLAAGTTAQQVDASFSTSSQLEVLSLDVASTEKELKPIGITQCDQRFHKIVWGPLGAQHGTICAGTDNGTVQVYDVQRLINNENPMVASFKNHSGPIHGLDMNPFQHNLLASGSRESEVFIWDLGNPGSQPYSPGAPSEPLEDVLSVAWNQQVQHILASAMASRCVVWDLRKSEPIIRVSDSSSRFRCKAVAWNPQVATQLCLASEDDHCPWLQIWDLRYASSPVKTLEKHTKGVLSINWNPKDQDMLVSCGKGSSVCIWNPNGAQGSELISELTSTTEWNFEVQWCPRNPALVSLASFSGEVAVYSVIGGEQTGNGDVLKKAPSWLSGGVGAQFGFGGKLITFSKDHGPKVDVAQVVTDDEFIAKVIAMEQALFKKDPESEFWSDRLTGSESETWQFLQSLQDPNPIIKLHELLGFSQTKVDEIEDLSTAFDNSIGINGVCKDSTSAQRIAKVLIVGDVIKAAELCSKARKFAEALFLADYAKDAALKENIRREFLNANRADSMCRLVACVSSGLWEELAELTPLDEWKTTLAAVLGHVADIKRANNLCLIIGEKLLKEQQHQAALIAFLLGRDLSKVAQCLIAIHGKPVDSNALQNFIEIMTAAKQAVGAHSLPKEISGIVTEYVSLLAEQGCLAASLHYLNDLDLSDGNSLILRDRILQSQGLTTTQQTQQNQFSMQNRQRARTMSSSSHDANRASFQQAQTPQYPSTQTNPYGDYNQSFQQPSETQFPHPPIPEGPPRPSSRTGKYPGVVDPSIRNSNPAYGYNASYASNQYAPPDSYGQNTFQAYSSRSVTPAVFNPSLPPMASSGPATAPNPYNTYQPAVPQPPVSPKTDLPQGNEYTADPRYSAPGWNDPPPLRRSSKPIVSPPSIPEATPLTCPLPGAPTPMPDVNQYFNPQQQAHSQQQQLPQQFQPQQYIPPQPPAHKQPPPVEKGPIPAEYQAIFNTLERLCEACQIVNNPLVQKKVDDVHKKLDHLGDKLRQYALSDTTVQNLQMIVDAIIRQDYNYALQVFGHVALTSNMSETSAFLPGIKTLLVIAQQNQVFV